MGLEMKYFVLKPRGKDPYARASRIAMKAYARSIKKTDAFFYRSLVEWVKEEENSLTLQNIATPTRLR